MNDWKRERTVRVVTGAVLLLTGLGLLLFPRQTFVFFLRLAGLALIICTGIIAVNYYLSSKMKKDFLMLAGGLAAGGIGLSVLIRPAVALALMYILIGILVIAAGSCLVYMVYTKAAESGWRRTLLMAAGIAAALFGLMIIVFPGIFAHVFLRIVGAGLVVFAARGLYHTRFL